MTHRHALPVSSQSERLSSCAIKDSPIDLDGSSLDISQLVATSCHGKSASIERLPQDVIDQINASIQLLHSELSRGHSIYGVTTGFGGSANTTTTATKALQVSLLQMQTSGILPTLSDAHSEAPGRLARSPANSHITLSMPEEWVRGAMLVRCNSLLRGHSAVRLDVIRTLLKLLDEDVIPLIPLRGSISASGDLCPLSYIAGVIEGNPDIHVWMGPMSAREIIPSDVALRRLEIDPVVFGPKECLGMINGTAVSTAVAGLAQHQADNLMLMSQVLTAMAVEALQGTVESFGSFISDVRPHRGQKEVAANILAFLEGSRLARGQAGSTYSGDLRQDRYSLRTAPQWLGPYIEDLLLSHEQIETELNSTTDNPLLDVSAQQVHHGGNFQAAAITSSTEKVRLAVQMIGKLLFAQSSELLNVHLNNGLPPNLAADEPSLSYTFKGVDINMAAYMSELAFLANPVSSHVQSAEMGNQSLNSLALISARQTHTALEVLSLMSSAYLYALCQALDLRAMNEHFLHVAKPAIEQLVHETFPDLPAETMHTFQQTIWTPISKSLASNTTKDSSDRFIDVAQSTHTPLISLLSSIPDSLHPSALPLITTFTSATSTLLQTLFNSNRSSYMRAPDATPFLGQASKRMYNFVRRELGVPFHRGLGDHPTSSTAAEGDGRAARTIGGWISVIHAALVDGRVGEVVVRCVGERGMES